MRAAPARGRACITSLTCAARLAVLPRELPEHAHAVRDVRGRGRTESRGGEAVEHRVVTRRAAAGCDAAALRERQRRVLCKARIRELARATARRAVAQAEQVSAGTQ